MRIFSAVEEPSELVVESLDTEMPGTIIAEYLVEAVLVGAGVEMVAEVEGETAEEAVAAVVEMVEEVEVDVRKDSHIHEENVEMMCLKLNRYLDSS